MEFQGIEVIDGNGQQQEKRYTTGDHSQITIAIKIGSSDEPDHNNVFGLGAPPNGLESHPSKLPRQSCCQAHHSGLEPCQQYKVAVGQLE